MNPLEGGHGPDGFDGGGSSILPFLGSSILLLMLLVAVVTFYLWRQGRLPWLTPTTVSAEQSAKQILAERMARGEMSTEEFLERSSMLNWTLGAEPVRNRSRLRLGRN